MSQIFICSEMEIKVFVKTKGDWRKSRSHPTKRG